MSSYDYDLFVIGGGSGGVRAARMAAARGARVALAEEGRLGGTCVNVGCVPKKLMVYASHYGEGYHEAEGFGWSSDDPEFDWARFRKNKDAEIKRLNKVYARLLHGAGVETFYGRGHLIDAHTVELELNNGDTDRFTSKYVLIATGGKPRRPTEPGTEEVWISDDVFELDELPETLLVVGGGYIALEMAGIFKGMGVDVTLAYRGPHPLRGFDDDARFFLLRELRKKGIRLFMNTQVVCLEQGERRRYEAVLSHDETIEVDAALYAIGRVPNTEDLGLGRCGVALDQSGAIIVDDYFRTSVHNVYALGDVTNRLNLTPVAIAEAMALVETLFGEGETTVDYGNVPTAVFCQPPLAVVGLTEAQARAEHGSVHVYTSEFRPLKHTLSGSDERTFMKLVVDAESDRVLGVHIVGMDAAEIIQGFAVALQCGATKAQFDATIGLHPTAAEELVTMRERRPDD